MKFEINKLIELKQKIMSSNKDNREHDRDEELQNKDRDQKQQDRDQHQKEGGINVEEDKIDLQNPQRLQDKDHKMDRRTNEVQGEVSYEQNKHNPHPDAESDMVNAWKDIETDYRKRYPNITDEDVHYKSGEFDSMTDRIAKRTNRNRQDVNNEIKDWQSSNRNS